MLGITRLSYAGVLTRQQAAPATGALGEAWNTKAEIAARRSSGRR